MSNWFLIIHSLGAVQGVFLATILVGKRRGSIANAILAVTMLAFALDLAAAVYHATGYDAVFSHLIGIDYPLAFLYGPLLYLYVKTLTLREQVFRKRYLWHFLPFALLVLFLVPFYVLSGAEKLAVVRDPESDLWTQALGTVNHFKLVHALVYIGIILSLLKRHRHRIRDTFSSTERINLVWLRNLVIGIIAVAGLAVVTYLLALGRQGPVMGLDPSTVYDDYMLLGLALFVYAIGFMGLRQPEIFDGRRHESPGSEPALHRAASARPIQRRVTEPTSVNGTSKGEGLNEKPQYARSGLDPESAERLERELLDLMDAEKPYLRGDLTLQDLSDAMQISPHNLTEVINTRLGHNFYEFVNVYRVREVKVRLTDPANAHLTLLAVAIESGFNSKSAFNAIFKKYAKMTPSQFRSQAAKTSPA